MTSSCCDRSAYARGGVHRTCSFSSPLPIVKESPPFAVKTPAASCMAPALVVCAAPALVVKYTVPLCAMFVAPARARVRGASANGAGRRLSGYRGSGACSVS